jgi:hypothetical protein
MDKDKIIALWEQHLGAELFAKDVDATMATMTREPYVNHVPTMTGGVGAAELRRFYAHHFISRQPDDFEVVPVSRTVGEETRRRNGCTLHAFLSNGLFPPGSRADTQEDRGPIGSDRPFSGREASPRAYLLGSGVGSCPGGLARSPEPPDRRRGGRPKGARPKTAGQCAYVP